MHKKYYLFIFIICAIFLPIHLLANGTMELSSGIDLMKHPALGKITPDTQFPLSRLPKSLNLRLPAKIMDRALDSSGLYYVFETDSPTLTISYSLVKGLSMPHMSATGVSGIDIYKKVGDSYQFIKNTFPISKQGKLTISDLDAKLTTYILVMPLYNRLDALTLSLSPGSQFNFVTPFNEEEVEPIIVYGTSIIHGCSVSRPGLALPNQLRFRLNWPVVSMGFDGSAYLEKEMSDFLSNFPSKLLIIDPLWNCRHLTKEEIYSLAKYFVTNYHQHQPNTPILLVGQSHYLPIHPTENEEVFIKLYSELSTTIENLYYLPGGSLIGSDGEGTVDGVHPNDLGMGRQTDAYEAKILEILKK